MDTLLAAAVAMFALLAPPAGLAAELPLIDAHIHYSHDAWGRTPPEEAIGILRRAGLTKAFVSSSGDEGTQKLLALDPDLVVPVLRPYRRRGETDTWLRDESVIEYLESRLARHRYAGIGEFHVTGEEADLPVMRRVVSLAREHGLFLHAHADSGAVRRIFAQDPDARVLWAHAGFADVAVVRSMLSDFANLRVDLAFRSDVARDGTVTEDWRDLFTDFPDRFMVGTDTFTPTRWDEVVDHAERSREWLADLPTDLAERIAWRNAEALLDASVARVGNGQP